MNFPDILRSPRYQLWWGHHMGDSKALVIGNWNVAQMPTSHEILSRILSWAPPHLNHRSFEPN